LKYQKSEYSKLARINPGKDMNMRNVCWCIILNSVFSFLAMGQGVCVDEIRAQAGAGHWEVDTDNPVFRPGGEGEWDAGALGSMTVVALFKGKITDISRRKTQ
jgi:hypothetical protein